MMNTRIRAVRLSKGALALICLVGCASAPQPKNDPDRHTFLAGDAGLWDGRPTLGGVWIAHPDVQNPERVVIENLDNGKSVIAALIGRSSDVPGPRLQLSSDAATALAMAPGAAAPMRVVALSVQDPAQGHTQRASEMQPAALDPSSAARVLDRPFIQVGVFAVAQNAARTAERLQNAALPASTSRTVITEGTYLRVLVGPAPSPDTRRRWLDKIREIGFTDAYPVRN